MKMKNLIKKLESFNVKMTKNDNNVFVSDPMIVPCGKKDEKFTKRYVISRCDTDNNCLYPGFAEFSDLTIQEVNEFQISDDFIWRYANSRNKFKAIGFSCCGKWGHFYVCSSICGIIEKYSAFDFSLAFDGKNWNISINYNSKIENYVVNRLLDKSKRMILPNFTYKDIHFLCQIDIPLGVKRDYIFDLI